MSCLRISHEDDATDGVGGSVPLSHQEWKSVLLEGNEFQLELISRLGDESEVASHLHPLVFPFNHFNVTRLRHFRKVLLPYVYHSSNSSSSFFVKEEGFYHILQLSVPFIMGAWDTDFLTFFLHGHPSYRRLGDEPPLFQSSWQKS
jgi:hypothetical protein